MTAHLTDKRPPRYACERCHCEIGVAPDPHRQVLMPGAYGVMSTRMQEDDDPMVLDDDCPCNCHELWNLVHRGIGMPTVDRKPAGDGEQRPASPLPPPAPTPDEEEPW